MEGGELEGVVAAVGVGSAVAPELAERALKGREAALEDVGLVDLVREHDEAFLRRELEDRADVGGGEGGARGVSGIDDDDGADVCALFAGGGEGALDCVEVRGPVCGFLEVVGDAAGVEEGERRGVEGVLGDWDEDAGLRTGADDVHEGVDAGGGAGGQEDVVGRGGVAVAPLEEVGDASPYAGCALALAVCSHALDVA